MAENNNYIWAKSFGESGKDRGYSISVDSVGNVYTTGYFTGTVDFDSGAGTTNLSSNNGNVFISKLDSNGNLIWAKNFGGSSEDNSLSKEISLDSAGNIYISGYFKGTIDFDPGAGIANLTSNGDFDSFVSKLDSNGNFLWANNVGGITSNLVNGNEISLDSAGNVYTTGYFTGTVDFDPGAGIANLTSNGDSDSFVSKLNSDGNFLWAKNFGGSSSDSSYSVNVDSAGNVYTTGTFIGTADFDPSAGTANLTSNKDFDFFASKLDSNGNFVWAKNFGGYTYGQSGIDIFDANYASVLDSEGNIYTTGYFTGTADFDPNAGTVNLTSNGDSDFFVSKLDSSGSLVWAKSWGGIDHDISNSISIDSEGNVYTISETIDFDSNSNESFISKLDNNGNLVWTQSLGGSGSELIIDSVRNIYTTGYFTGTVDFDPSAGTVNLTSKVFSSPPFTVSSEDIFISKLGVLFEPINAGLTPVYYTDADWGDYDNDGDLDLITIGVDNANNSITQLYTINNVGNFIATATGLPGISDGSVNWGDYDQDGDLDLLLGGFNGTNVISRIYQNNAGVFNDIGAGLTGLYYLDADWGDYDNDGDLDIIATGYDPNITSGTTKIYRNDAGVFTDLAVSFGGAYFGAVAWGDYDNDQDLDILLTGYTSSGVNISHIYQNDSGNFININAGLLGLQNSSAAWGDYDNDGDLDILLTGTDSSNSALVYRNDGGNFVEIGAGLTGVASGSGVWGDYDNDGDLDILLTGIGGGVNISKVYRNEGGSFADIDAAITGVSQGIALWGDYDNDQDLDIFLTGNDGATLFSEVYRNNTPTPNTLPASPANLNTLVDGSTVTFNWDAATDDQTPTNGLSYNLQIGTTPTTSDVMPSMSLIGDSTRQVVQLGNANQNTSWTLNNLPYGTYYWTVQSVDSAFAGSTFPAVQTVVVPPPTYEFSLATFTTSEGNITVTPNVVEIIRTGDTTVTETITVSATGGTATAGTDYTASSVNVTFGVEQTSAFVPLEILGDTNVELDETINLAITNFSGSGVAGTQNTATLTLTNDDTAYAFTATTYTTAEGDVATTPNVVEIVRTGNTTLAEEIRVSATGGTAIAGTDYTADPFTVSFAAGQTNAFVPIEILGDLEDETDETIDLQITQFGGTGVAGIPDTATLTLTDADVAGVTMTQTATRTDVTEAGTTDTYSVVLNSIPTNPVTVTLTPSNPEIDLGSGEGNPVNLNFAADATALTPQIVTVTAFDDQIFEGNHSSVISHSVSSLDQNYNGGNVPFTVDGITTTEINVNLTDNDNTGISINPISGLTTTEAEETATFEVILSSQPTADVSFNLSSNNPNEGTLSTSAITFNATNWDIPQIVTITGVDDSVADGSINYSIITEAAISSDPNYNGVNPDDVTVTNTDNDNAGININPISGLTTTEAGETATFEVVLSSQPTADVSFNLSSNNPNEGTLSTSAITFNATNWDIPQIVTITGVNDSVADGSINYSIITEAAISSDPNYNGVNPDDIAIINADNETPGITVNPTAGLTTTEAGGSASFSVVLNTQPIDNVTIGINSNNLDEGMVLPSSVDFTPTNWNIPQIVTITGVDDNTFDGDISYSIITSADTTTSDPNYNGFNPANVTVINTDDEVAEIKINPITGLTTTEVGGTANFEIVLSSQPTANVRIDITSSNTNEGTLSTSSVVFTSTNWNIPQTVTVTGVDDLTADGNIAYTIITDPSVSNDPNFNGVNPDDVAVENADNETPGITVNPTAGLITTENGDSASFEIVLNTQPIDTVTLGISSDNLAEGTVSTSSVSFTPTNWNTPQIVTVTGVDDTSLDGDISYPVRITGDTNTNDPDYNSLNPDNVTVTNTDNDIADVNLNPISGLTTTEAGGTATFDVVLSSQPTANVIVNLESSNPTEGTLSASSLSFNTTNWQSPRTVTVTGVDDEILDGDTAYTILTSITTLDSNYSRVNPDDVTVINTDNDAVGVNINPTTGLTTTEAGESATFDIVLSSQPTSEVTVNLSSNNLNEGILSTSAVTLTQVNWNVPQTVTVTGVDDDRVDGNISYNIATRITSNDLAYANINPDDINVTNFDDDTATIEINPTTGLTTAEAGGTANFEIVLSSQPTGNVTINLRSDNTAEGTLSSSSVIFTPENWNVPQNVTITGVDDSLADGNTAYSIITNAAVSSDLNFNGVNPANVSVINADNETPGITVNSTAELTTTEAGETTSFTIVLNTQPTGNVRIGMGSNNRNEGTVSTSELIFTPENWNFPQTVTVTGVDDFIADGDIPYTIITDAATSTDSNYNNVNPNNISITNLDDDNAGVEITPTSGLVTTETGETATFDVVLTSQPADTVLLNLNSSNLGEGTLSSTSVSFNSNNWNQPKTVTVTGVDDVIADGDIAYTIITNRLISNDPNYNTINPDDVAVTNTDNEIPGITINPTAGLITSEVGETASFTVVLNTQPTANVTLDLSSDNPNEGTISASTLTFTPNNWDRPQTVTITGVDDEAVDGDVSYTILTEVAASNDPNYIILNPDDVSVINTDNDVPGVNLSVDVTSPEEGNSSVITVTATASETVTGNQTVDLIVTGDVTTEDYLISNSQISILDGTKTGSVTLTVLDDEIFEGDEIATITLQNLSSGLTLGNTTSANLTILDNDKASTYNFSSPTYITPEGNTTNTPNLISILRSGDTTIAETVTLTVTGGTATSTDYTEDPLVVDFAIGQTEAFIPLEILGDRIFEPNETIELEITEFSSQGVAGTQATAILTLENDDPQPTVEFNQPSYRINEDGTVINREITLTRSGDTSGTSTVEIQLTEDTATAGEDFTDTTLSVNFAAGETTQTITIPILEDEIQEGQERLTLELQNPSNGTELGTQTQTLLTIQDNDQSGVEINPTQVSATEGGVTGSYNLVLNSQPTSPVSIRFNTTNQIASLSDLTFNRNNWNIPQTVTITATDDNQIEGDHTSLIRHTISSEDPNFDEIELPNVTVEITDNDSADISVSSSQITATENGESGSFEVVLTTQPTTLVTINFETSDQLQTVNPITFNRNNWNQPKTVTVTATDDQIEEGIHQATLIPTLTTEDVNYQTLELDPITVEIADNDQAGVSIRPRNLNLTEGGITNTYEIVLTTEPSAPVIIEFNPGNQLEPIPNITFNPNNWNQPQTIIITAVDDAIAESTLTQTIVHSVTSTDPQYADLALNDVTVTLTDNDTPSIILTQTDNSTDINEAGLTDTYTIALSSQPTANVSVTITPDSQTNLGNGADTPLNLTFTPQNWNQPQTVTVAAVDDDDIEDELHTSNLVHTVSSSDPNFNTDIPILLDGVARSTLIVNISENDQPLPPGTPGLTLNQPLRATEVWEGFGYDLYKLVLASEPIADVIITINSDGQTITEQQTLTFTPTNWNIPQLVKVTAVDDNLPEGNHNTIITHIASSADSRYDGQSITNTLLINDNDNRGENLTLSEAEVIGLTERDDVVQGSATEDIVYGRDGNDHLIGNAGNDFILAQGGADGVFGEAGNDIVIGGQGNDFIEGGTEDDIAFGSSGNDRLFGNEGNDQLFGDFGNDRISGDGGSDTLTGFSGNDVFVIGNETGSLRLDEADIITDFQFTQDRIELLRNLTFNQLKITQGTDDFSSDTVIQISLTGEYLAVLLDVDATALDAGDFI